MKMVFVKEESEENTSEPETWRIKHEEPETCRIKHEEPETWRIKHEEPETWRIKHEEPETWRIKHEEPETSDIIIISKFEAKTEWSDFSFVKLSYTIHSLTAGGAYGTGNIAFPWLPVLLLLLLFFYMQYTEKR